MAVVSNTRTLRNGDLHTRALIEKEAIHRILGERERQQRQQEADRLSQSIKDKMS